jgi:nitrogen-specific signal transduction histidine kinase
MNKCSNIPETVAPPPYISNFSLKQTNLNNYVPTVPDILNAHNSELAFSLAHEIQIPLSTIKLSLEMLESTIENHDLKIYLEVMSRNTRRINNLISKYLKAE